MPQTDSHANPIDGLSIDGPPHADVPNTVSVQLVAPTKKNSNVTVDVLMYAITSAGFCKKPADGVRMSEGIDTPAIPITPSVLRSRAYVSEMDRSDEKVLETVLVPGHVGFGS